MLDLSSMSAPTSLTISSKMQQSNKTLSSSGETISPNKMNVQSDNMQKQLNESDLINNKFNELARKIFEELKQSQYSKDFFQAVDEIIKEPISQKLLHKTHSHLKYISPNKVDTSNQENYEPLSLPPEMNKNLKHDSSDTQRQQALQANKPRSSIPVSAQKNHYNPKRSNIAVTSDSKTVSSSISKSGTTGKLALKRQTSLRRPSGSSFQTSNDYSSAQMAVGTKLQPNAISLAHKEAKPSSVSHSLRGFVDDDDDYDDVDIDDDEGDGFDDADFEDDGDYAIKNGIDGYRSATNGKLTNQQTLINEKPINPITKSKTLGDATSFREVATKNTGSAIQQISLETSIAKLLKQRADAIKKQQQPRVNPLVRSNTITSTKSPRMIARTTTNGITSRTSPGEPKSMQLTSKDIGSLYKPHMNYSTSVLGNHRLSDDDEIIIIPTQSPSLMSNSPDGEANADELTERFSISRTKSFWEKLSKGNQSKLETCNETTSDNTVQVIRPLHSNKATGVSRSNRQSRNSDRTDSTSGSNSNYNGSSSGDEADGGLYSQQNPTVRNLKEMSRQNRFRQTR